MDPIERLFLLHRLLIQSKYPVPLSKILEELRCSDKTFYRIRRRLESICNVEIENVDEHYYRYNTADGEPVIFPGLFFTHEEIEALYCFSNSLNNIQAGILDKILQPFRKQMSTVLKVHEISEQTWNSRIKIVPLAQRKIDQNIFKTITTSVLHGKKCRILYKGLSSGEIKERDISPQTLLRYRDNWYVDAFCHTHTGLRTFALSRIITAEQLQLDSVPIDRSMLDQHYTTTYGIFNGTPAETAIIHFSGIAAQEIFHEEWHPAQKTEWINDTTLELSIPYCDATELVMDILRWGDMAEVISPQPLREKVKKIFENGVKKYSPLS